jgi:eukaryotic-like serine/threonine-protein kinase
MDKTPSAASLPASPEPDATPGKMTGNTGAIATDLAPGESRAYPEVEGYEILGVLGHGGMGLVYRARQLKANRLVAIKMIRAVEHASPQERIRFEIETEAVARLQHPHIVQLHEVGDVRGQPFFSLEFCEGGTLAAWLKKKSPTPREVAELMETLARAMHYAHLRGVVHRDLKPGNVLLMADGTPKITDFGLAKRIDAEARDVSQSGAIMGTAAYMAPEQAAGKVRDTGPAADVYGLGALLYECLTGQPPFTGPQHVVLVSVLNDEPVPPTQRSPKVPRDLETICLKCLHKEPEGRYASAAALAEDLARFRRGEPIAARPVGRVERGVKWVRRNPAVSALAAAVLLVLTAGMVASSWFALEAREESKGAHQAEKKAEERADAEAAATKRAEAETKRADKEAQAAWKAKKETEEQLRRSELLVYAGKLSLAVGDFAEGKAALALHHLEECQWNLRGWEHDHLWTRFTAKQTLRGHTRHVYSVAFSPDGKRILTGSLDRTAKLWDAETGQEILSLEKHTGPVQSVAFSPDGKRILTASADRATVWNAETGQEILSLQGHTGLVFSVAFSPDGKRILTGRGDPNSDRPGEAKVRDPGKTKLWDAETGKEVLFLEGHTQRVNSVAFSPDGERILTGSMDRTAKLWDAKTGKEILSLVGHTGPVDSVVFSPDGKRILTGSRDRTAKLWDARTGKEIHSLKGHTGYVLSVAYSPDGKFILTGSEDKTAKVWDAEKGQEFLILKAHIYGVSSVAFSPDGKRILTGGGDGTTKVWEAEKNQETLSLRGHRNLVESVAFSPDGKRIVTGSMDRTAKLWDAGTGREVLFLQGHTHGVSSVAFSPDGKRILTGSLDKTAKVWDTETGQEILSLKGHTQGVSSVAFSPDGKRILTGSHDNTATVWDAKTGHPVFSFKGHTGYISSVAFSPDGKRILTGGGGEFGPGRLAQGETTVWDAERGQEILSLEGHTGHVNGVAFSPDGKRILTGSMDKTAKVWNAETGQAILSLKGHTERVISVAFSPDGKRILTGSGDTTVKVWEAETGQEVFSLKGHIAFVRSVAFSPDGNRILTGSQDMTAKVWGADKGQDIVSLVGHTHTVTSIVFSPDGNRILTGSADGTAKLWDARTGKEIHSLEGHTLGVNSVAFSSDGKRIFAWDKQKKVLAWSTEDGKPFEPNNPPFAPPHDSARSPDGSHLALGNGIFSVGVVVIDIAQHERQNLWPLPNAAERRRYHSEQATLAEKDKQWCAVAFHLGRLLLDAPDDADLKRCREEALRRHEAVVVVPVGPHPMDKVP